MTPARRWLRLLGFSLLAAPCSLLAFPASAQLALRADTVYTMAGAPIVDGVVLVENGRIREVGPAGRVRIPDGWRVLTGRVATPGLIDARATVGLTGLLNQRQDQDHLDRGAAVQPELRALDAYNPQDSLVAYLRSFGITTVHTGHSAGALAAGTTAVFRTVGTTADGAALVPEAMVALTLGEEATGEAPFPGTRARAVAALRADFLRAADYARRRAGADPPARDLKLDALAALLDGSRVALVSAHRAHDIGAALRLQREFGFRMVLDGGAEAYLVLDDLRAAGVPVAVHPTMMRAGGAAENVSMDTPARLHAAGLPFAFTSAFEGYVPKVRVVLFEASVAVGQGGLPRAAALHALTAGAARLLGLDARLGSLAPGLDADVVLWDGDPLEYTTHACTVVVGGVVTDETCR